MISICLCSLVSCGENSGSEPFGGELRTLGQLESLLLVDSDVGFVIGGRMDADEFNSFRSIADVAFHPQGELIAVLDRDPPFLRVFDSSGGILWTGLPEGEGPGEAEGAYSVSINEMGVLVRHSGNRVSLFTLGGTFLDDWYISDIRYPEVGPSCRAGRWTFYGQGLEATADGVGWLWEIDPTTGSTAPLFFAPMADRTNKIPAKIRYVGGALRFDHAWGDHPAVFEFDCISGEVREVARTVQEEPEPVGKRVDDDDVASFALRPPFGIRRLDLSRVVHTSYSFDVVSPDSAIAYSQITVSVSRGWRTGTVNGELIFHSQLRGRWVAVGFVDPVPGVRILPEKMLEVALEDLWDESR